MQQDLHRGSGSGQDGSHRLKWWICFSGVLHLALILTLLAAPPSTAWRDSAVPVYTVDLVAGDGPAPSEPGDAPKPEPPRKREARAPVLDTVAPEAVEAPKEVQPRPKVEAPAKKPPPGKKAAKAKEPRKAKKAEKVAKPRKAEKAKKVAKPKKPKKVEKVAKPKKVEKPKKVAKSGKLAEPGKAAKRKAAKPGKEKAAARKKAAKAKKVAKAKKAGKPAKAKKAAEPKRSDGGDKKLVQRLKQRRIDAAVATARERARMRRETGGARSGRGSGAGTGNGVGGLVRGRAFVDYRERMLGQIKENWFLPRTGLSRSGELEVTVGFGVRVDGEIVGVELLQRSGDASFDELVVRAVRRASPLPPPPRSHAREFAQVELTFRPGDLDGRGPSG